MTGSLRGKLLVATPDLGDPSFFRTVVLLLEHNLEGALGEGSRFDPFACARIAATAHDLGGM